MTLALIWAQAANGVIGKDGGIPWHLPEDMKHFRAMTVGSTVLMGRVTWQSLPPRFRPLPDRRNLVLTHSADWSAPGAEPVATVDEARRRTEGTLWVIGGGRVYSAALPDADRLVVTELELEYDGDTFAPQIDPAWRLTESEPDSGWLQSTTGARYRFRSYER